MTSPTQMQLKPSSSATTTTTTTTTTITYTYIERVLHYDHHYSSAVHSWSFGLWDYLIAIPGLLCGSHLFPLVLFWCCYYYGIEVGCFMISSSVSTVLCSTYIKRYTRRHRPAPENLSSRRINLRSLLTNYSFPSGDSAQGKNKFQHKSTSISRASFLLLVCTILRFNPTSVQYGSLTLVFIIFDFIISFAIAIFLLSAAVFGCTLFLFGSMKHVLLDESIPLREFLYLLIIPAVMFARVYYGAHWWMDTVGGVCLGALNTLIWLYMWDGLKYYIN